MIPRSILKGIFLKCKPRASGDDPAISNMSEDLRRVNPARAGMIPKPTAPASPSTCKPRASGDDPVSFLINGGFGE